MNIFICVFSILACVVHILNDAATIDSSYASMLAACCVHPVAAQVVLVAEANQNHHRLSIVFIGNRIVLRMKCSRTDRCASCNYHTAGGGLAGTASISR
jgi:hypothetical protein